MNTLLSSKIPKELRESYVENRQGHVFKYIDNGVVKDEKKINAFIDQLENIDPAHINSLYMSAVSEPKETLKTPKMDMEPIESFGSLETASTESYSLLA